MREVKEGQSEPVTAPPAKEPRRDIVDSASRDSFPASDPPSWNGVRLGSPSDADDVHEGGDGS